VHAGSASWARSVPVFAARPVTAPGADPRGDNPILWFSMLTVPTLGSNVYGAYITGGTDPAVQLRAGHRSGIRRCTPVFGLGVDLWRAGQGAEVLQALALAVRWLLDGAGRLCPDHPAGLMPLGVSPGSVYY